MDAIKKQKKTQSAVAWLAFHTMGAVVACVEVAEVFKMPTPPYRLPPDLASLSVFVANVFYALAHRSRLGLGLRMLILPCRHMA